MGVTEYKGARYVPKFTDNPNSEWTSTVAYEPLTIVLHNGNSYTSRQAVPIGIDITNTDFWAETGNYNAQIESYRGEVIQYANRIKANADAIAAETTARENVDTQIETDYKAADTQIETDYKAADTQIETDYKAADTQIETDYKAADAKLQESISAEIARAEAAEKANADNIEKYKGRQLERVDVYVDCINGDDNNKGTSERAPLKTFEAALNFYNYGYNFLTVILIAPGTYKTTSTTQLTSTQLHVYSTVANVTLDTTSITGFYNSYLHFEGTQQNHLRVYSSALHSQGRYNAWHYDGVFVYSQYCDFEAEGNIIDVNGGCFAQYDGRIINASLIITNSHGFFSNVSIEIKKVLESMAAIVYVHNSDVVLEYTCTITATAAPEITTNGNCILQLNSGQLTILGPVKPNITQGIVERGIIASRGVLIGSNDTLNNFAALGTNPTNYYGWIVKVTSTLSSN